MWHDEALAFSQLLLGLLLFTLGIPALIIEFTVDASLRHVLHKRMRPIPMLVLMLLTLSLVVALILLSGTDDVVSEIETTARFTSAVTIVGFAVVWIYIYMNVRISLVIKSIHRELRKKVRRKGTLKYDDEDLKDLLTLGENLHGGEKAAVIDVIGAICRQIQTRKKYSGTEMRALIPGLRRVVEGSGTDDHHVDAFAVIAETWQRLNENRHDDDGTELKRAAGALGELAVKERSHYVVLRWLQAIDDEVDVPYRIGASALTARRYSVAVEALSRLSMIANKKGNLPRELIALVAYFHDAGPSAGQAARDLLRRRGSPADAILRAAESAAEHFKDDGDFTAADAIRKHFVTREASS